MTYFGIARSEVGFAVSRYGTSENLKVSAKGSDGNSRSEKRFTKTDQGPLNSMKRTRSSRKRSGRSLK